MAKCGGDIGKAEKAVSDVVQEHIRNKDNPPNGWRGSVINMSIGYITASATDLLGLQAALQQAKNYGIPVAAAAGNNAKNRLESPSKYVWMLSEFNLGKTNSKTQIFVHFQRGSSRYQLSSMDWRLFRYFRE